MSIISIFYVLSLFVMEKVIKILVIKYLNKLPLLTRPLVSFLNSGIILKALLLTLNILNPQIIGVG